MGVSIIDGTVEGVVPGRRAAGVRVFKRIVFRLPDGGTRTIAKSIVHADLAERFQPGASGRFYHFTAIDHRGFHGWRGAGGEALFRFPRNNERLMMIVFLVVLTWGVLALLTLGDVPILAALLLVLTPLAWLHLRKVRRDAQRQFEADQGRPAGESTPAAGVGEPAVGAP